MANLTDFLAAVRAVANLRPIIGAVVDEVEALFPDLPGKDKLQRALDAIDKFAAGIDQLAGIYETAKPLITALIAAIVSLRHAAGMFKAKA